jgi:hypothetical protein
MGVLGLLLVTVVMQLVLLQLPMVVLVLVMVALVVMLLALPREAWRTVVGVSARPSRAPEMRKMDRESGGTKREAETLRSRRVFRRLALETVFQPSLRQRQSGSSTRRRWWMWKDAWRERGMEAEEDSVHGHQCQTHRFVNSIQGEIRCSWGVWMGRCHLRS